MSQTKIKKELIDASFGTDWVETIQTSNFTAAAGKGYFVDTTSDEITVTLPIGIVGTEIVIQDYAGTFATNKFILNANGSEKIQGSALESQITTNNATAVLIYQDATKGWTSQDISLITAAASGGTEVISGSYKYHTFTSSGTFTVTAGGDMEYLVIAGGGGGGHGGNSTNTGGGGGAGALIFTSSTTIAAGSYTVTVGIGGAVNANGSDSSFNNTTADGGGAGGDTSGTDNGNDGGSGGGAGPGASAGSATTGGSNGGASNARTGGGGGGAGAIGGTSSDTGDGAPGGDGVNTYSSWATVTSTGDSGYYSGGGGSGDPAGSNQPNLGGAGGGGNGGYQGGTTAERNGQPGQANTGGGGGSAADGAYVSAAGGSGIIIIRYSI